MSLAILSATHFISCVQLRTYTIQTVGLATQAEKDAQQDDALPSVMLGTKGGGELVLKEGGAHEQAFGLPLKLDFKAAITAKGVTVDEASLIGVGGESYIPKNNGSAGKGTTLETCLRAGTQTVPGAKLSYG